MNKKTIITLSTSTLLFAFSSLLAEVTPEYTFEFFDADKSGSINHKEYKDAIFKISLEDELSKVSDGKAEKKGAYDRAHATKEASLKIYKSGDLDRSHNLDESEFYALHPKDVPITEETPESVFSFERSDIDGDGFLTVKEYKEGIAKAMNAAVLEDGARPGLAWKEAKKAKADAMEIFKTLDKDGNKLLSPDEL